MLAQLCRGGKISRLNVFEDIFKVIVLLALFISCARCSEIEDRMETQIDPREPRQFTVWETLNSRQTTFKYYQFYQNGQWNTADAGNWEIFATTYWYETRIPNATCPMLPQGIAAACDWALMVPCLFGNVSKPPRTIFVHNLMLPHFVESTSNFMNQSWPYVLVTAGTDQTIPAGWGDVRYGRKTALRNFGGWDGGPAFKSLMAKWQVIHWFAENHDINHPKMSTLPTGLAAENPDDRSEFPHLYQPIKQRPLVVMSADRIRAGTQWQARSDVYVMCKNVSWCLQPFEGKFQGEGGVSHKDFLEHLATVPFIACVHGGGIDPSPKAWEALLVGTIPIIQHSTLDDGYSEFPVAFVSDWKDLFQNPKAEDMLKEWLENLAPHYERGSLLRLKTLEKLRTSFWVRKFHNEISEFHRKRWHDAHNGSTSSAASDAAGLYDRVSGGDYDFTDLRKRGRRNLR